MHIEPTPQLTAVRLAPDVALMMQRAAKAEDRSAAAQINRVLRLWAVEHGYGEPAAAPPQRVPVESVPEPPKARAPVHPADAAVTAQPAKLPPATISRDDAKAAGRSRYYTGVVCRRGHLTERYTGSGQCVACQAEANRQQQAGIKAAGAR